jgi:uroporphyrin-III C-methyltransferase
MRVATGTLETIVAVRDESGIEPPAITVIGDVAETRERVVEFLENRTGESDVGSETTADADERAESEGVDE